uniref:Uncharacterized protein n=1 Tax=Knipowitschia caucasica TaxID=637954 RepID=A0AAV2L9N1_KNICA
MEVSEDRERYQDIFASLTSAVLPESLQRRRREGQPSTTIPLFFGIRKPNNGIFSSVSMLHALSTWQLMKGHLFAKSAAV